MESHLYTLFSRGRPGDLHPVGDGPRPWGFLGPIWALGAGLWLTALAMAAALAAAAAWDPRLIGPVWAALAALSVMEGAAMEHLERRLRGWRSLGVVEARSIEGAEELWWARAAVPAAANAPVGAPGGSVPGPGEADPAARPSPEPTEPGPTEPGPSEPGPSAPGQTGRAPDPLPDAAPDGPRGSILAMAREASDAPAATPGPAP